MKNSLLLILVIFSNHAVAASYKWVDNDGRIHYSDQAPVNKKAKILTSNSSNAVDTSGNIAASSAPVANKTYTERAAELKKKQLAAKEDANATAQQQAQLELLRTNCANAKKNLVALQNSSRMVEYDENGERAYMSDEKRQQNLAKAQQDISNNCK